MESWLFVFRKRARERGRERCLDFAFRLYCLNALTSCFKDELWDQDESQEMKWSKSEIQNWDVDLVNINPSRYYTTSYDRSVKRKRRREDRRYIFSFCVFVFWCKCCQHLISSNEPNGLFSMIWRSVKMQFHEWDCSHRAVDSTSTVVESICESIV